MDVAMLQERARIIRQTRSFFDGCQYIELDTPLLSPNLIPESCLEVFETTRIKPGGEAFPGARSSRYWLIPSPEIWMKRIIAQNRINVYQICKCFRNGESSGFLHSPEFTMLEYYTMYADYLDSLALTGTLFERLAEQRNPNMRPPFERITVGEAFERWAGFDLYTAVETGGLESEARRLGLAPPPDLGIAALYDLIFIHAVEPNLPQDRPVALLDYPAFIPCLAKQRGGIVERWELYYRGIELANCYSEETCPEKVRAFFENEAAAKEQTALVPHAVDHQYWKYFLPHNTADGEKDFPRCSGVALGIDRLIMALTGRSNIDSVLPFPMDN